MKLNFKNIGLILGLGAVMAFQACTDLEPKLYSELDKEQFESSPEAFEGKLGDVYVNLQREYGYVYREGYWALQENSTDEIIIPTRYAGDWYDSQNLWVLHNHDFTSKMREVAQHGQSGNNAWNFIYRGITKCNDMLRWMADVHEKSDKSELTNLEYERNVAEVKILRAWYHYLALDVFGNVPWVASVNTSSSAPQLRREQVFDSIMVDLETNVPKARKLRIYTRVDQYVGYMVMAKMYLNADAWEIIDKSAFLKERKLDNKTACYAKAAEYCDLIIKSNQFSLSPNYFDNFKVDNESSPENIWCVYYDANFSKGMQFHMMTLHYANKSTYGLTEQPWNGYCGHHKLMSLYAKNADAPQTGYLKNSDFQDVRVNCWERGEQDASAVSVSVDIKTYDLMPKYVRKPANYPKSREEILNAPLKPGQKEPTVDCMFKPFFTDTVTTLTNTQDFKIYNIFEGPRFVKFQIERGVGVHMSNDFPIFRLADTYLMLAEAIVRAEGPVTYTNADTKAQVTLGLADAQAAYEKVRSRAGLTTHPQLAFGDDNSSTTLGELCNERCRELLWEGFRRQDLIRFDRFTGPNAMETEGDPYNLWIIRTVPFSPQPIITPDYKKVFPLPDFTIQGGYVQNTGYTE